jgi:uncharacterized protein YkwD
MTLAACAGQPADGFARDAAASVVNEIRAGGCAGRPGISRPLRPDPALDAVAGRVALGSSLADAVAEQDYPARKSASIAAQTGASTLSFRKALTSKRNCGYVIDPMFERIGVVAQGSRTILVFAAPFTAPEIGATDVAARALTLVNAARAKSRRCGARAFAPAPPLRLDAVLTNVAVGHARDMAQRGRMSHEGSDGSEPAERMTRAGYPWSLVAENVAAGQTNVDEVVATWLESPGHCANIMNAALREMGIALAFEAGSPDGTYWVQTLGTRRP